jgi:PKD repeat protein
MLAIAKVFQPIDQKFFLFVKELFIKLFNIILYNPVVRKVSAFTFLTAFITGSIFLVFFAIVSPELPPDNLFSSLKNISEYQGIQDSSRMDVVLSPLDEDWIRQTLFNNSDFETGAGSPTQDRSRDFEYPVRPGETLSEIAFAYDIPYDFLAWYNKITNADRIRFGTVLIIPSLENIQNNEREYQSQRAKQRQAVIAAKTARSIEVTSASRSSGAGSGITVNFSIVNPPANLRSYEWDLGDGKRSFHENPSHEYTTPRTYTIRLTAQDISGTIYKSNHLYIDIPYPASIAEHSTVKFVTLSSPDEHFVVNGKIIGVSRHPNMEDVIDLSESDKYLTKVKFKTSGYFGITVLESKNKEQYYSVFVSPIPTMHVDNVTNNSNWYRTQFNTGTPSNCGPATTAMGISWATGRYFPVSTVRQAVGWHGDGGTSFDELFNVFKNQGVNASFQSLKTAQDIRDVIDSGSIAIILFLTSGVKMSRQNPANDLFGRYYNDSVGHYVVVKGYSLNGDYFVIHDPIPSDWSGNSFRYADEISMIGRNRYFPVTEVLKSLRRSEMIIVPGQN